MASVQSASSSNANDVFASLGAGSSGKSTTDAEDIQNRFLKLLTTQLKNQDPLNPMDNAQMTSQLAQINTISGIEKLNVTLGKMLDIYLKALDPQRMHFLQTDLDKFEPYRNRLDDLTLRSLVHREEISINVACFKVSCSDLSSFTLRSIS